MPRARTASLVLALTLLVGGCSTGSPTAQDSPSASATPSTAASSAPPAPAAPAVGSCHALDVTSATAPTDARPAVPCTARHTSVTIAVGRLSQLSDGHLLAVDSTAVQQQVAQACPRTLARHVGGDRTTQRLSRFQVVAFTPTLEQADAGADWYRCDLLALRTAGQLVQLPARTRGILGRPGALDRFGTCGTAAPGTRGFQRVVCGQKHTWRAVKDLDIASKRYLDKAAGARGDAACKAIASQRAAGALKFSWSFEWPTQAQWQAGQRWGLCWLPEG